MIPVSVSFYVNNQKPNQKYLRNQCVHKTVQEAVIKTIPKKKKFKKAKQLSEEALHTAEKQRESKGKGDKGRYTHLKAEFQRLARRDKKASSAII